MLFQELNGQVEEYRQYLEREERSTSTRLQYIRDVRVFLQWAENREIAKETVILYKEKLQETYKATSVNVKLAAVNGFLAFVGRPDLKVRQLKIQRQAYCSKEKELTRTEYEKLVNAAKRRKNQRLALIMQTICSTGIRVSELPFITAEAVWNGEATVRLKGKTRTVFITGKLQKRLKEFLKHSGITSGPVFVGKNGAPLNRSSIWRMMKSLCGSAGVDRRKVFPHNLRHLFARCFYRIDKDLAKLADILGHSSIETTRIYIVSTGTEHKRQMEALHLVM